MEWILSMIDELFSDSSIIESENYQDIILNNISELYLANFEEEIDEDDLELGIIIYFSTISPKRSSTFLKFRKPYTMVSPSHIEYLKNIDQPTQKTQEWYEMRYNLITASNAWKALSGGKQLNSFIYEKCLPLDTSKYMGYMTSGSLYWGILFEEVSVMLYEYKYNTIVEDFGCIRDKKYSFLGASPDGINVKLDSPLYGRMLEIKNVVNREITGSPKREYWIQMQLQMNICELNECDFLETKFEAYNNYNDFMNDGNFTYTKTNKLKGIIMSFIKNEKPVYEYMPLHLSEQEYEVWETKQLKQYGEDTWIKNIYWRLEKYSCVLVIRNKRWFNQVVPTLSNVWDTIIYERINGYEHRKPNKHKKREIPFNKCCVNMNNTISVIKVDTEV